MDEPVDALEVDEGAEVDDVGDGALDDVAGREPVEDRLAHLAALLLQHGPPRQDDVVAAAVELDHLAAERLAHELVEVLDAADVDQRRRQEAADAEVEDQAALDHLDDDALDGLAALGGSSMRFQPSRSARFFERIRRFRVLLRHDERVDLVAEVDLVRRVDRAADGELETGMTPSDL